MQQFVKHDLHFLCYLVKYKPMFGIDRRRADVSQISSKQESYQKERGDNDQPNDDISEESYDDLSNPISLYDVITTNFLMKFKKMFKGSKSTFGENRLNHIIRIKKRNYITRNGNKR